MTLTTTQYRVDVQPYATKTAALTAIEKHRPSHPDNDYTVRVYADGYYVMVESRSNKYRGWLITQKKGSS